MTKLTKTFLVLGLAGFLAGGAIDAIGTSVDPKWTVVLPLGAVFFGLFLIFLMLQKEMAAFDHEETARMQLVPLPALAPDTRPDRHQDLSHLKHSPL
jgi:hypothetical protein